MSNVQALRPTRRTSVNRDENPADRTRPIQAMSHGAVILPYAAPVGTAMAGRPVAAPRRAPVTTTLAEQPVVPGGYPWPALRARPRSWTDVL